LVIFHSNLYCCCRTDKGVHALRNVCQIDVNRLDGQVIQPEVLRNGLNYFLDAKRSRIYISDVVNIRENFNARMEAKSRTYMYRILNHHRKSSSISHWSLFHQDLAWTVDKDLNMQAMIQASQYLLGEQDFASFRNARCQSKSSIRHIKSVEIYLNKQLISSQGEIVNKHQSQASNSQFLSLIVSTPYTVACLIHSASPMLMTRKKK
jgi:tRNA pseudouridine38-40 synthase